MPTGSRSEIPPEVRPLGAILAGGESRRYGVPKALATVGGLSLVERARRTLLSSTSGIVLLASDPRFRVAGLPLRGDVHRDIGPLAGVHAALLAAQERGAPGVLVLACDLPLVPATLVHEIVRRFTDLGGERVVLPRSPGPLGMEPLCACYPVGSLPEVTARVEAATAGGGNRDASVIALVRELDPVTLSLDEVARFVKPEVGFLNVNRPEDRERAERLLVEMRADG